MVACSGDLVRQSIREVIALPENPGADVSSLGVMRTTPGDRV